MKREIAALTALGLLCVLAGWNVFYVRGIASQLSGCIVSSREGYEAGDWEKAEAELRRAIEQWQEPGSYIAVSLRHSEIDAITDNFYDLLSHICDESAECRGGYEHLLAAVQRLADMETPALGSIF